MKKAIVQLTVFCWFLTFASTLECFDKVVLWGHKLHSHTHSYIHESFYKTFKHLGYQTFWFDNKDDVNGFDFANSLFITEGQVDEKIPIRNDCQYILHNCNSSKYQNLDPKNWIVLQVYTDAVLNMPDLIEMEPCIYYDLVGRTIYMPWATDLLPHEIEEVKASVFKQPIEKTVYWVGTIGEGKFGNLSRINPFKQACQDNGIIFKHVVSVSSEKGKDLIKRSYLAPAIVGEWQEEVGYIPCRIFKNISYGKLGVTNSWRVHELFERKTVYNSNTRQLFYDARERLARLKPAELFELMDMVKDRHTYINRVATLLDFLELVNQVYSDSGFE